LDRRVVAPWDGIGLPPAVQARLDRARSDVRTSLLSVSGEAALASTGFQAVGDVIGCVVTRSEPRENGNCGSFGGFGKRHVTPPVITSGSDRAPGGFAAVVTARYSGWDRAIARLCSEAKGLGADGVVDVRLSVRPVAHQRTEYLAMGTAVRATHRSGLAGLFTTTLDASACAKLISVGWMPLSIVIGISVAIRHDDYRMRMDRSATARNKEIEGLTALANAVRHDARQQLDDRGSRIGADGVILSSAGRRSMEVVRAGVNHYDHVAEQTLFGDAIAAFADRVDKRVTAIGVVPTTP
jgi:uncharacterized protein YbjQ (UPF0145 family)